MPKQIELPPPHPTPQPPTDARPSSFVSLRSSRRGRGGRIPYATPRNTYSQAPIRWAVQPPSTNTTRPSLIHIRLHIRHRLDALPSSGAFGPSPGATELASLQDDRQNVDDATRRP